jgi:DNA-binding IscR family transcriptional regulator
LARSASEITLRDVFAALESNEFFTEHRSPERACAVGPNGRARGQALEHELWRTTIADIAGAALAEVTKQRAHERSRL